MARDRVELRRMGNSAPLQLLYNLQHDHGQESVQLPFVIGVLAPLLGNPIERKPLANRTWKLIDRDNFDEVMAQLKPELNVRVKLALRETSEQLLVALRFQQLDDFDPPRIAEQVPALMELKSARQSLGELLRRVEFDDSFKGELQELASNTEAAASFLRQTATPYSDDCLDRFRMRYRLPNRSATANLLDGLRAMIILGEEADPMGLITDLEARLKLCESRTEGMLAAQLREILHDPSILALEASWRGLFQLVRNVETGQSLRIKLLAVSKEELREDLTDHVLQDSTLYRQLLSDHRSGMMPEPIGMLLADYAFHSDENDGHLLKLLGSLARQCHCPLVANASPEFFKLPSFRVLAEPASWHHRVFAVEPSPDFQTWNRLRADDDFSHILLTLPGLVARKPWGEEFTPCEGLHFEEFTGPPVLDDLPWMGAAWAYAMVVADCYARTGWFVQSVGVEGGGKVEDLPKFTLPGDEEASKLCLAECLINDSAEDKLGALGLTPLVQSRGRDFVVFFRSASARLVDLQSADLGQATLLSRWTYHLGIAHFAQSLRRIVQEVHVDLTTQAEPLCELLNQWLQAYCRPIGAEGPPGQHPLYSGLVTSEKTEQGVRLVFVVSEYWPADAASQRTTVSLPINLDSF